jgi:hypothetical protein
MNEPTIEQLSNLYVAAVGFRDLKPWQWMSDIDLFAVQDTINNQTGYCCVMGQAGELFGLAVYLGDEGFGHIVKVLSEDIHGDELFEQRALLLTFEDRQDIDKEDYKRIKLSGYSFRGRKQWPVFRSYVPGFYPWYLNSEEVSFFTQVLNQAIDVCQRVRENPKLLENEDKEYIFARRSIFEENGVNWEDTWLPLPLDCYDTERSFYKLEDLELNRRKKTYQKRKVVVEFDIQYIPEAVQEKKGERPYFPVLGLWMERQHGLILGVEIVHPNDYVKCIQEKFFEILDQQRWIPETIEVQKEKAYHLLAPIAQKLGINLKLVPELPMLETVVDEMLSNFAFYSL